MSDEAILIVALLGGIAVLCGALLRFQWRKEKRLAARTEIDVPIQSLVRSVLVIVPAMIVGPVLGGVVGAATDPWARQHALAATLGTIGLGVAGLLIGWRASRRYCRVGLLRYTPTRLELQYGKARQHIDLEQPYELEEGLGWGPAEMPLQVLYVRQGHIRLGFSYGLPLGRKPYGERGFDRYASPLVDAEARVIHDRLRQQLGR